MPLKFYTLNAAGQPVYEPDKDQWQSWFDANLHATKIAETEINDAIITTVFIGHAFESTEPVLWETMVFGGRLDQVRDKCAGNLDQAKAMHEQMCQRVRDLKP